ncbi:MAG: 4-hydroxybenzoate octaprenyltransferase [Candidatus Porifericomitaceae bacterium WSBS_2022_MAG_OTU9]
MPSIATRIGSYARLLRLHRPVGTVLLLWPVLWALWAAASGLPPAWVLVVFSLGAVLMRSAGCALNDYMDRDIDAMVERTKDRPLPAGELHPAEALFSFALLSLLAFGLICTLGAKLVWLAVAGLALAMGYPLAKRYLPIPQLVLGLAFSWSIPMAFIAVLGEMPNHAWLMFAASVIWVVAYDTIYALADRKDDNRIGIHSSAIVFGKYAREAALSLHALCLALLTLYGFAANLHLIWYLCLAAGALLVLWQWHLLAEISIDRCLKAFSLNGWFGLAPFTGLVLHSWLR